MKATIYIATHKQIDLIYPRGYKIIELKSNLYGNWDGYCHDNFGDNISDKIYYCELSALYWIWKNDNSDIKGLCHYRRFFSNIFDESVPSIIKATSDRISRLALSEEQVIEAMSSCDVIVTQRAMPYPLCGEDEMSKYVYKNDLDTLKKYISENCKDYYSDLIKVLTSKHLCFFNMMIAKKSIFDDYCKWLFNILFSLEKEIDSSMYDENHKRIMGYFGELLLNVYLSHHKRIKIKECKTLFIVEDRKVAKKNQRMIKIDHLFYRLHMYPLLLLLYKVFKPRQLKRYKSYLGRD